MLFFNIHAQAEKLQTEDSFLCTKWTDGMYFLGGFGPSAGFMFNDQESARSHGGLNLSTSVGYSVDHYYSIEIGSIVSVQYFDKVPGAETVGLDLGHVIFWDTAFFWALRVPILKSKYSDNFAPYIRMFQGWGNGVGFIYDIHGEYSYLNDSRTQLEGPIMGVSFGNFFNTFNEDSLWFIDVTFMLQFFWDGYVVSSTAEVPVVLEKKDLDENYHKIQLHVSCGVRFF